MSTKIEELKQKLQHQTNEKRLKAARKRKTRSDMRKKAKRSITNLALVLTKIGTLDCSENDYALIFKEDKPYFEMLQACNLAYLESFKSKVKLRQYPEEFFVAIQTHCLREKIELPTQKQLSNQRFLNGVLKKLSKKGVRYQDIWPCVYLSVSKKNEEIIKKMSEEQAKKEPLDMRRKNSKDLDLYSKRMKEQNALQIATRVFERILEEDKEFLKKPLEQIVEDFQKERDPARR